MLAEAEAEKQAEGNSVLTNGKCSLKAQQSNVLSLKCSGSPSSIPEAPSCPPAPSWALTPPVGSSWEAGRAIRAGSVENVLSWFAGIQVINIGAIAAINEDKMDTVCPEMGSAT